MTMDGKKILFEIVITTRFTEPEHLELVVDIFPAEVVLLPTEVLLQGLVLLGISVVVVFKPPLVHLEEVFEL